MALSADQKAALQLLLERGQSYGELADLLGIEEAEVRERARSALRELGGTDPDRRVAISDYLLGQADPIGRADVVRHLRDDPEDHRIAAELVARIREVVPGAELPRLPGEPRDGGFLRRMPGRREQPSKPERPSLAQRLPEGRGRLLVVLGSGAVLLIAIVLALTGAFGGDDGGSSEAATTTDAGDSATAGEELTQVELSPPGGGDAQGVATFGLASADQPYVEFDISGLDAPPQDETYVIWLMLNTKQGYPLSPIAVSQQGTFQDRFAIPSAILPIVARVRFVDVSLAPAREIQGEIVRAIERSELVLEKPGRTVLLGELPANEAPAGG
jgi:hypothetical protein